MGGGLQGWHGGSICMCTWPEEASDEPPPESQKKTEMALAIWPGLAPNMAVAKGG